MLRASTRAVWMNLIINLQRAKTIRHSRPQYSRQCQIYVIQITQQARWWRNMSLCHLIHILRKSVCGNCGRSLTQRSVVCVLRAVRVSGWKLRNVRGKNKIFSIFQISWIHILTPSRVIAFFSDLIKNEVAPTSIQSVEQATRKRVMVNGSWYQASRLNAKAPLAASLRCCPVMAHVWLVRPLLPSPRTHYCWSG